MSNAAARPARGAWRCVGRDHPSGLRAGRCEGLQRAGGTRQSPSVAITRSSAPSGENTNVSPYTRRVSRVPPDAGGVPPDAAGQRHAEVRMRRARLHVHEQRGERGAARVGGPLRVSCAEPFAAGEQPGCTRRGIAAATRARTPGDATAAKRAGSKRGVSQARERSRHHSTPIATKSTSDAASASWLIRCSGASLPCRVRPLSRARVSVTRLHDAPRLRPSESSTSHASSTCETSHTATTSDAASRRRRPASRDCAAAESPMRSAVSSPAPANAKVSRSRPRRCPRAHR